MALLQGGDIRGLEPLFRLHQVQATRTAYLITSDRSLAEDAVMDAFLAVYDHIGQFDPRRPFLPWFYRIVVNNALMVVRKARRSPTRSDRDDQPLPYGRSLLPDPEEVVMMRERQELLVAAFNSLPPKQRAALALRCYLDMDEATIAQTLSCPLGTVKWRLYAARQKIRRTLGEEFSIPVFSASGGRQ